MEYEDDIDPAKASLAISNHLQNTNLNSSARNIFWNCYSVLELIYDTYLTAVGSNAGLRVIGSVGEGLNFYAHLNGTASDIDFIIIPPECKVYDNADVFVSMRHWQFQMEPCETNSGYVKLKVINEGKETDFSEVVPSFIEIDAKSNIPYLQNAVPACLMEADEEHQIRKLFTECILTGPSCSRICRNPIPIVNKMDLVISIPCPTWPSVASEWVTRKRVYGWPSKEFILEHKQKGCLVVPVGCKECDRSDLDWRLSFVLVEKALIWDFNITQVHCLVLLKQLKTFVFEKQIGDIISSYILKVIVFWMIEESHPDLWVPHRLLTTVKMCLDRLISCVQNDFCPSYFIRTCNLLAARYTCSEKMRVIQTCLTARQNTRVLLCQTPLFSELLSSQQIEESALPNVIPDFLERVQNLYLLVTCLSVMKTIQWLFSRFQTSSSAIRFCERTIVQLPGIRLKFDFPHQWLATLTKQQLGFTHIRLMWTNFYLSAQSNKCRYRCIKMLRNKITEIDDLVEAVNFCHLNAAVGNDGISKEALELFILKSKVLPYVRTTEWLCGESSLHMQLITDIQFLRFEIDLLPPPMQMEMCPISDIDGHFDLHVSIGMSSTVAVDPLVYACFLRFWCCVKLDQNIEKLKARDDMVWCCGLPDITYKAVAYNLLGFCHKHLEEYDEALRAFWTAWKQTPRSNATIVHIGILVNSIIQRELNATSLD